MAYSFCPMQCAIRKQMSGHSKWSTIKRQKGATDAKRGKVFTKLSNAITLAVKQGGGVTDPSSNVKLRFAVDGARSANMPKDNIDRAIDRAVNKQQGDIEEIVYEGFGPGGFSVMVEAITDNKQRTTPIIKSIFDRGGGTLGTPGSVAYQFEQKGQIIVKKNGSTLDEIFLIAADSGAEDVEDVSNDTSEQVIVYTNPSDLAKVRDKLVEKGYTIEQAELIRKPLTTIQVSDKELISKIITFLERIEDEDDVQKVYANYDIPDS